MGGTRRYAGGKSRNKRGAGEAGAREKLLSTSQVVIRPRFVFT